MAVQVSLNTPLSEALNNVVQPKLVEVGWSMGGADDSALSEYIILMLVNGKTQDQIASELSNDLLNLGPDDSGAIDFSRWLFEQVEVLNKQINEDSTTYAAASTTQPDPQSVSSQAEQAGLKGSRRGSRQSGSAGDEDAEMGDAGDGPQEGSMYVRSEGLSSSGLSLMDFVALQVRKRCATVGVATTNDSSGSFLKLWIGHKTRSFIAYDPSMAQSGSTVTTDNHQKDHAML